LTTDPNAANAAFQAGYESPSQFRREYSRLFGAPPLRDITDLRQQAAGSEATGKRISFSPAEK
jgi:AraC-like DNA-binding protein